MIIKELRNGVFTRSFSGDRFICEMDVESTNNTLIEPHLTIFTDNQPEIEMRKLNENYLNIKNKLHDPLIGNEKPLEVILEFDFIVDGESISVKQKINNWLNIGRNYVSVMDCFYQNNSLRNIVGDNDYLIRNFKIIGKFKKLRQLQIPFMDVIIGYSSYYSNINVYT